MGWGDPLGAIIYASDYVKDSNFARLYLFGEQDPNFKEVYRDETPFGIYGGGVIGPIRIWEVVYPADTKTDEKYLERSIYG